MNARVRSLLRGAWPPVGSLYLLYLATRPPPARYVGILGLVVVVPLLGGWLLGTVADVGPWAENAESLDDPS
jgi:hypothetical protein